MTAAVGPSTIAARSPNVHTYELDGEAVLLDEPSNQLHLLNATATQVWAGLDGVQTIEALSARLAGGVGADGRQVLADVAAVVQEFVAAGIAVVGD